MLCSPPSPTAIPVNMTLGMSAMLRFLLHAQCRSHRAAATPSKHFSPTNMPPGNESPPWEQAAHCTQQHVLLLGRARGECLGKAGRQSSHYGPRCIKKKTNINYFSRNLSTFVFKSNTKLVNSNTIHLSCCKTTSNIVKYQL